MAAKAWKISPLVHDVVKRFAPWHNFIGAPGFPENWLFNSDSGFGISRKVEVSLNSKNRIGSIVGTNSSNQTASIEYSWDDVGKISKAVLKKGSTTELTIEQWFAASSHLIYIDTKYAANSDYDTQIRVSENASSSDTVDVEIDINGKTLTDSVDINSSEVPQILTDLVAELNSMESTATVAALDPDMLAVNNINFWKDESYGILAWQDMLNIFGTALSDTFGVVVTGVYGVACYALAEESKAVS